MKHGTTTGEVIHECGFLHPSTQPCPNPDRFCVTEANGDCVSTDPRDMHAPVGLNAVPSLSQADGLGDERDWPEHSLLVDEFGSIT
jgi:hypothetical protein